MQGLVSFLNVPPTQPAPTLSDTTVSPGDTVDISNLIKNNLLDTVTSDIETVPPGDIDDEIEISAGPIAPQGTLSPGDTEILTPGDKVGTATELRSGSQAPNFAVRE